MFYRGFLFFIANIIYGGYNMNDIENYSKFIFESIKHIDENGHEYWYARELQMALEYKEWRKFNGIIDKAIKSCINSSINIKYNFVEVDKIVNTGVSIKPIKDYKLYRYACYLIVQNGDSRKEVIALGQTYFAVQTRKQEILDYFDEDKKKIKY